MTKLLFLLALIFFGSLSAQELEGSWKLITVDGQPVKDTESIRIYKDGYFSEGTKEEATNRFINVKGGEYTVTDAYSETYDFASTDSSIVGQKKDFELSLKGDELMLKRPDRQMTWKRISSNKNELSGNWVITGRKRDGEISRSTPGARRTIKILGGDRFQWVAFNSDTGEFFGSGGGTYSAKDGQYVENLEFFSRDDSRVGAKLPFQYEIKNGEWHHSGKNSKGEPMYEIWSPYKVAYNN
ncbi:MAG: hypothetical protein WBL21_00230 [Salinimicrobium sp.]